MSNQIVCDQCGKTTDPGVLIEPFSSWLQVTRGGGFPTQHFCSDICLAQHLEAKATA